jgi:hypothetical protein
MNDTFERLTLFVLRIRSARIGDQIRVHWGSSWRAPGMDVNCCRRARKLVSRGRKLFYQRAKIALSTCQAHATFSFFFPKLMNIVDLLCDE